MDELTLEDKNNIPTIADVERIVEGLAIIVANGFADMMTKMVTKEEFNEKWTLPAYLRRGVKMDNVPHSSESFISRYNLNDDNNLLGNNKFLHDNVD